MLSCLFIVASLSPAEKRLTFWLSCVLYFVVFLYCSLCTVTWVRLLCVAVAFPSQIHLPLRCNVIIRLTSHVIVMQKFATS